MDFAPKDVISDQNLSEPVELTRAQVAAGVYCPQPFFQLSEADYLRLSSAKSPTAEWTRWAVTGSVGSFLSWLTNYAQAVSAKKLTEFNYWTILTTVALVVVAGILYAIGQGQSDPRKDVMSKINEYFEKNGGGTR